MSTVADQLYRDIQNLTDADQQLAKDFLAMLAHRKDTHGEKNEREVALTQARYRGEATATEFGYTALPVDPLEIAGKAGIVAQAKPMTAAGVSGMLLRHGENFGI